MKRIICRFAPLLLLAVFAVAQTPTQTPQQNYPNESQPAAPQTVQQPPAEPQHQPVSPNPQAYPSENPQTPSTNVSAQSVQPPVSQSVNSDQALKDQLQRTLAVNPRLSDVQPVVNGGQVTLTGTVPTEADRADAKRVIEEVSGVNKVVDEMTIGTTSHQPPGGNSAEATPGAVPQSDVYGKGSSAQGAAHGCECPKGQLNGKYPGSDEPCACSGTNTHAGESQPSNASPKPVPPR